MVITNIDAIPIAVDVKPLEEEGGIAPYVTNNGQVETSQRMIIKLETDTDVTGWGEMMIEMDPGAMKALIEGEIAPKVVGRPVWEIESFLKDFFYFYVDIESLAGGIEMAMWDALGKQLETPVHKLLGGKCSATIPVSYCVGILDPEESREHAKYALDEGYSVLKTKGGRDWRKDIERIVAMHDEVSGKLDFRIDPNQGWTFEEAVRVGAKLEDQGVYVQYLEQPIRIETYGSYKRLRQRLRQPIGANDDAYFDRNLYQLVKSDSIDVGVVDIVPTGISGMQKLAGIAEESGVSLAHHCGFDLGIKTAAMAHTVSSTPAFNLPADTVYYSWTDHIIESPFNISDGRLTVPDDPGLGISVIEDKIKEHRIEV